MDNYCKTCLHDGVDIGFCDKCYYNHILEEKGIPPTKYEAKPKPITNADRIRNGYYIASDACGRDKNGKFVCVCGKCRVMRQEEDGDNH